jgi:hypothetical protein
MGRIVYTVIRVPLEVDFSVEHSPDEDPFKMLRHVLDKDDQYLRYGEDGDTWAENRVYVHRISSVSHGRSRCVSQDIVTDQVLDIWNSIHRDRALFEDRREWDVEDFMSGYELSKGDAEYLYLLVREYLKEKGGEKG